MEPISTLPTGTMLRGGEHDYRIEKMLGSGSFGITYMASYHDSNGLTIFVAIKEFFMREINGRSGTSVTSSSQRGLFADYRRKFAREAQNLTRLDHKNIIKIIEYFECNNTSYYAMEYLADGSLNDYISLHGPLPEKKVLLFASQIGAALSYMHAQRMLHLDLKPGNIMMRGNDEVVLIDFGLSKCYDANGEPESSTTIGGGTEGYAPLEQGAHYDGEGLPVTMDVYAFGATMYKMLTACKKVYNASYILNAPYGFIASTLTKLSVSQPVANIVSKAMRPYIKDRYQTVEAMLKEITPLLPTTNKRPADNSRTTSSNEKTKITQKRTKSQAGSSKSSTKSQTSSSKSSTEQKEEQSSGRNTLGESLIFLIGLVICGLFFGVGPAKGLHKLVFPDKKQPKTATVTKVCGSCNKVGTYNSSDATTCKYCGKAISPTTTVIKVCNSCNKVGSYDMLDATCMYCGKAISSSGKQSKTTTNVTKIKPGTKIVCSSCKKTKTYRSGGDLICSYCGGTRFVLPDDM